MRGGDDYPTNICSVNLVIGCSNARAGVRIVGKKRPLEQPNIDPPITNYHWCRHCRCAPISDPQYWLGSVVQVLKISEGS